MEIKSLGQYQAEVRKSARYPDLGQNFWYPCLGLIEARERLDCAASNKKPIEAGNVAWHLAQICSELDLNMSLCSHKYFQDDSISIGFVAETVKKWHLSTEGHLSAGTEDLQDNFIRICKYFWHNSVNTPANFTSDYPDVWAVLSANLDRLSYRP